MNNDKSDVQGPRSKVEDRVDDSPTLDMPKAQQSTLDFGHGTLDLDRAGPVECLGRMFANDEERRDYFLKNSAKG